MSCLRGKRLLKKMVCGWWMTWWYFTDHKVMLYCSWLISPTDLELSVAELIVDVSLHWFIKSAQVSIGNKNNWKQSRTLWARFTNSLRSHKPSFGVEDCGQWGIIFGLPTPAVDTDSYPITKIMPGEKFCTFSYCIRTLNSHNGKAN